MIYLTIKGPADYISSIIINYLYDNFYGADDVAITCIYFNYKKQLTIMDIIRNVMKQILEQKGIVSLRKKVPDFYLQHQEIKMGPRINELPCKGSTAS
jgi:hypothetical protein